MVPSSIERVRASQERAAASGATVIGFVVNYDADSIRIKRTELKSIFESEGFGEHVPESIDIDTALSRAKSKPVPKGMIVQAFARQKGASASYGVYVKTPGDGESGDTFPCGARVRVDDGRAVALAPEGAAPDDACLEVATRIARDANELVDYAETGDVTAAARSVVQNALHGMPMRTRGGLYFVRPGDGETWQRLAARLQGPPDEPTGFVDLGFPMTAGAAQAKAASHAVKTGLESKLAEVRTKVEKFDDSTRDSTVEARIAECEALTVELGLYAEILGDWQAKLVSGIDEVKRSAQRALAKDAEDAFGFAAPGPVAAVEREEEEEPAPTTARGVGKDPFSWASGQFCS